MLQEEFVSRWSLLDMFQIHIGLADFCRSEAEARVKPTAGPKSPSGRTPRTLGGAGGGGGAPRCSVHIPLIRVYSDYSLVSRYTAL